MDISRRELLKAAEIVAVAKTERVELVLEMLKQAGFDLSDDLIQKALLRNRAVDRAELLYTKNKRENRYKGRWAETDNPIILSLRHAYLSGFKVADIAKAAGLPRTAIYELMSGYRNFTPVTADSLVHAFNLLSIPYPPDP